MKYTKKDEARHIREALRNGDTIDKVCYDYDLTFPELLKRMSSYGSGKKDSVRYTGERYIMKHYGHYVVRKNHKYFGSYRTLSDAIKIRDWFMVNRWDRRWVDRACRECRVVRCTND